MLENQKDLLCECFHLYRDENFLFRGVDEGYSEPRQVIGCYNRGKVNPKEPDLRLYYFDENTGERSEREFLALWVKISRTGRKYLIGNSNGICYIGLINLNRFDDTEPYLTIYYVMK